NATGGNPGGNISATPFSINVGALTLYVVSFRAPAKFTGNLNTYFDGTLRFDLRQPTAGASFEAAQVQLTNTSGVSIWYYPDTPFEPTTTWTTFSIRLND